jgi:hypothetical protein
MRYCVPVVIRKQVNYIVEADSVQQARHEARIAFNECDEPAYCGNEWEEIDRIGEVTEAP